MCMCEQDFMASVTNFKEVKEFFISFPGGEIAAKAWGNESGIPVLALHGWQDNAGTFDRLLPLLTPELYVVCIDHLGHGLSTHKPPGTFYNYIDMLIEIKRVVNYLKWDNFSIMGHSLGATLALMYGSLFPENILNIISLDMIKPASRQYTGLPVTTKYTIQEMLRLEAKLNDPTPVYSPEQAKQRLMKAIVEGVTEDGADALLKRGTKISPCGNGVVFTRDIRTKTIEGIQLFSHDSLKAYLTNLKCNLLIIVGSDSQVYMSRTPEVADDFLDIYKKNCESFEMIKVKGNHFFHLNNPENAVEHINAFFKKQGHIKSNL